MGGGSPGSIGSRIFWSLSRRSFNLLSHNEPWDCHHVFLEKFGGLKTDVWLQNKAAQKGKRRHKSRDGRDTVNFERTGVSINRASM